MLIMPDSRIRPKKPMSFQTETSTTAGMAQVSSSSQPGPSIPKSARMLFSAPYSGERTVFQIREAATQEVSTGISYSTRKAVTPRRVWLRICATTREAASISGI